MNEPVAWMFQGAFDTSTYVSFEKPNPDIYPNPTPLFTHLAKTLTDEEIEQVRVAIMGCAYWCADENMPEAYNAIKVCCGQVLGILVKAQEK
jgi:hypothetical protein